MFAETKSFEKAKQKERLRFTSVRSNDGLNAIDIYSSDKREVARKLVAEFSRNPHTVQNYNFKGLDLSNTDLSGINLRVLGADALRRIDFSGSNLSGQNFSNLNLRGARFAGAHMEGVHLEGANIERANLTGAYLVCANLEGVRADGAIMNNIIATGACLDGSFKGVQMASADLRECHMGSGNFENAVLNGSNLSGINNYGNMRFVNAKMQFTTLSGDFRNANFGGADLTSAFMEGGSFEGAFFDKAIVHNVKRDGAIMDASAFNNAITYDLHKPENQSTFNSKPLTKKEYIIQAMMEKLASVDDDLQPINKKKRHIIIDQEPSFN